MLATPHTCCQVNLTNCVCKASTASRLRVGDILPRCSLPGLKIDIVLMSVKCKLLLGMMMLNNDDDDFNDSDEQAATIIHRAVHCTLCALAFSRWGVWRRPEPLVALVLSPTCLRRLTFSKADEVPSGLHMTLEETKDP